MASSTPNSATDRPTDVHPRRGRRRTVTVLLTAALAGAVGAGAYEYFAPQGASVVAQRGSERTEEAPELVAFTDADTADCVNWSQNGDIATDFEVVDCASPHRFEVATREDLSQYPTSEFGPDAPQPDLERQAQLTSELCEGPTRTYLDGRLDPQGRYSIVPILPPEAAWDGGDRTMLCGVAVPDADGVYAEATGRAAETDQSPAEPPETCMRARGDEVDVTDCDEPYSWQVTSVENLGDTFDGAWPTIEQQNDHLDAVCTAAAIEFLGGGDDENLYQSTLTPFWTTLPQESWNAGSRTVNCALTKAREGGGFADLQGDVRGEFTIDGNPPAKQPERNPRRDQGNNGGNSGANSGNNGGNSAGEAP